MNEKENLDPIGNNENSELDNADQAFSWDWESDKSSEPEESAALASEADSAETDNNDISISPSSLEENINFSYDGPSNENSSEILTDDTETVTHKKQKKEGKKRESRGVGALVISCILSSSAITFLLTLTLALMLGLISPNQNRVTVQMSNGTSHSPEAVATHEMLEKAMRSVVIIKANNTLETSTGTGVIMSDDGYIITNYHVIENMNEIKVYLYGSNVPYTATSIGYKKDDDVAVIKISASGLDEATFASSKNCRTGETVYAIGSPEGSDFGWSVARGIISSPDRELKMYDSEGILTRKMNVIQTDAPLNHGNSGGPLINAGGEVIGIVTLRLTSGTGVGFAIPSDGVLIDAISIIEKGHADDVNSGISVKRPLLGITGVGVEGGKWYENEITASGSSIREVTEEYATSFPNKAFYAEISGIRVSATSAGLDAASKLRPGDIITEVDGIVVENIYEVMDIINGYNGGDGVSVKYYRNGSYKTINITLGEAN